MQHIYIIRHGQSAANANQLIAGQQESPLSDLGEQQALQAAEAAASLDVDIILASPMQRTRQTADIIAQHLGLSAEVIQTIPDLIERGLGALEGKHYDKATYGSGNTVEAEQVSGIEPIGELYQRCRQALDTIHESPGKTILVVCHNGTGRMLMNVAAGGEPLDMYSYPRLENAQLYPLLPL